MRTRPSEPRLPSSSPANRDAVHVGTVGGQPRATSVLRSPLAIRQAIAHEGTVMAMTGEAEAVLREALALPTDDRADIAAGLLASLDDVPDDDPGVVRDEWARELRARARRALAGEAVTEDWNDVRRRVADQLGA